MLFGLARIRFGKCKYVHLTISVDHREGALLPGRFQIVHEERRLLWRAELVEERQELAVIRGPVEQRLPP